MENKNGANGRKTLIVDPAFQTPFVAKFFFMVAAGSLILGAIVYFFCTQTVTTVFKDSRLKIVTTADFILPGLLIGIAVVIAVVGIATALMALYASHRIAGPVYRIRRDLRSFKAGSMEQVFRVREKDEIKALAAELDEMARAIQKSMADIKAEVSGIDSIAEDLSPTARKHLAALKKILDTYRA
ncbi:MAG: hypothetical protein V1882_01525 [Candidatus Omnitrophota bacterium]